MGILDEVLQQLAQSQGKAGGAGQSAAPNAGSGTSPLATIFQDLLTGSQQNADQSRQQQAEAPQSNAARQAQQGGQDGAASVGGLGGLLAALQQAGLDDVVRSWVGNGQNKPVQPDQLGDALGKQTVTKMADKAGCNPNDLLAQLSKALPGIIDKLTHDGRIPTQQEVNKRLAS
jgi:uncharacterized protein YidB (DUF937 family)